MNRITSFNVDHDFIVPGMYVSRIDGDITTYDLRTRKPNADDFMDSTTMHSVEHMLATFARNSDLSDKVIYFGPMGCRTGFYLLMRDTTNDEAYQLVKDILKKTVDHEGEMFGAARKECGNYKELSLEAAKAECERYLEALLEREKLGKADFIYDAE
ncbi:MAG: S-ribosylhomocysteine lyase [Ruminococcaceae bacterium]|nr:S-ribosylhomocysteine lyase [Oscillospiraceae bacterium]